MQHYRTQLSDVPLSLRERFAGDAEGMEDVLNPTLLLFSGGRDSTLAAARLARTSNAPLLLVTISSSHLVGIDRVKRRLTELGPILPGGSSWRCVSQPRLAANFTAEFGNTCLPCQRDYVAVGAQLAKASQIRRLALGYASYQSDWPEQTPEAIERLTRHMSEVGLHLLLPVYALSSREEAQAELLSLGLSAESLEQKCLKQITNIRLSDTDLTRHLDNWEARLAAALAQVPAPALSLLDELKFDALAA